MQNEFKCKLRKVSNVAHILKKEYAVNYFDTLEILLLKRTVNAQEFILFTYKV